MIETPFIIFGKLIPIKKTQFETIPQADKRADKHTHEKKLKHFYFISEIRCRK